ncbi:hypothetical protein ACI77O_13525 [Pseudomonas tritici]|jgi:hypothetical protein|uniref:hypothetical protein n=1 Tax=Pseudomonas tritici TaxID=2745518 RepID=UPI00387B1E80
MSRHYIELPTNSGNGSGKLGIVCGYDRHPNEHFYCNVSESLSSNDIDWPIWASCLDDHLHSVTEPDGFDQKLADMGVTLPVAVKQAMHEDWTSKNMVRESRWESSGDMLTERS